MQYSINYQKAHEWTPLLIPDFGDPRRRRRQSARGGRSGRRRKGRRARSWSATPRRASAVAARPPQPTRPPTSRRCSARWSRTLRPLGMNGAPGSAVTPRCRISIDLKSLAMQFTPAAKHICARKPGILSLPKQRQSYRGSDTLFVLLCRGDLAIRTWMLRRQRRCSGSIWWSCRSALLTAILSFWKR